MYGYGYGSTVASIIALVFAIAATVVIIVFFFPRKNRKKMNKFGRLVHDFVNFKVLIIEWVLKAIYVFFTCFFILSGLFTIITLGGRWEYIGKGYAGEIILGSILAGFLIMILGPIIVRLVYELLMLAIIGVKNIIEINKKLPDKGDDSSDEPDMFMENNNFSQQDMNYNNPNDMPPQF